MAWPLALLSVPFTFSDAFMSHEHAASRERPRGHLPGPTDTTVTHHHTKSGFGTPEPLPLLAVPDGLSLVEPRGFEPLTF